MIDSDGNIVKPNYPELTQYAKLFSSFTPDKQALLLEIQPAISPHLESITDNFYAALDNIPQTKLFLGDRLVSLKQTHHVWLHSLFTGPYDDSYTESMYNVGAIHVNVDLPVEFMSGGMTLICNEMYPVALTIFKDNIQKAQQVICAINSVIGFSLFVMQKSYNASVGEELEKFLLITGMSRPLFDKLASTFSGK